MPKNGKLLSFDHLKTLGVTSEQLYNQWFVPVDVAEEYELFLQQISVEKEYLYNCSSGYFGDRCQYKFGYMNSARTFPEIVESVFLSKKSINYARWNDSLVIVNITCYVHVNCDRGPPPSCLDWREVRDGKLDCLDGNTDEKDCFEIELTTCDSFRCHIGQCIPDKFHRDDPVNPDCLDGVDESILTYYTANCHPYPGFRCEDIKTPRPLYETCGDGTFETTQNNLISQYSCANGRTALLRYALVSEHPNNMSESCWMNMWCPHPLGPLALNGRWEELCKDNICYQRDFKNNCSASFFLPVRPILLGHIRFAHLRNTFLGKELSSTPDYVCYDKTLCDDFTWTHTYIDGYTCIWGRYLQWSPRNSWSFFLHILYDTFKVCLPYSSINRRNSTHCDHDQLYPCQNSLKCISKHRLMDGVQDCFHGDDETNVNISCSLSDAKYRYKCKHEPNKCISPVQRQDGKSDCKSGDDEINPVDIITQDRPPFSRLCDGYVDTGPTTSLKELETDETHCEQWPCNNLYTRCDQFWHCRNGSDESRCINPFCTFDTHPCLSPFDNEIRCLPIDKADDEQVDCRGGTDERYFCRDMKPTVKNSQNYYQCFNETKCIGIAWICYGDIEQSRCQFVDDQRFCSKFYQLADGFCNDNQILGSKTQKEREILCNLAHSSERMEKSSDIYLLLGQSDNYPKLSHSDNASENLTSTDSVNIPTMIPSEIAWICNRGIPVEIDEEIGCFCPPSYYGSRCGFQNQRVSLTVQFRQEVGFRWNAIIYLPTRDCSVKFNIYLLYSKRPKTKVEESTNYSVRIDAYNNRDLSHHATWYLDIPLQFLPVNRISTQLNMPARAARTFLAPSFCVHGRQVEIENSDKITLCLCDTDWSGRRCDIEQRCDCSIESRCVGKMVNNRSICVCPLQKFGRRCRLQISSCTENACKNGGACIPSDQRISMKNFTCICNEGYFGAYCEYTKRKVKISFTDGLSIPAAIHRSCHIST